MDALQIRFQDTLTMFYAIIVGAIPFIFLGVLVSALLAVFIREERLLRFIPKNRLLACLFAVFLGFLFPVCECGNIPVAKRLIQKGVKPYIVATFLLAAPVINPVVMLATWSAFRFWPTLVYLRFIFAFIIAFSIGLILSYHPKPQELIVEQRSKIGACCQDDHEHEKENSTKSFKSYKDKFYQFIATFNADFLEMMRNLILGCFLAACIHFIVPPATLLQLGSDPIVSIGIMIIFAVITSACSNVDAFIALSYVNSFTPGSLLAFLVFGPLIDLKAIFMMKTIWRWRMIALITLFALLLTILFSLLINFFVYDMS